jgi:hypothetical protein
MTEKELKEKYFEMEKKFIDERAIKISEIAMNNKLREQIEVLRIKNKALAKINEEWSRKYAKTKILLDEALTNKL